MEEEVEIPTIEWSKGPIDETAREREYREMREQFAAMASELWLVAEGERKKGRKILEEMNYEFERQKEIRELIMKRDKKWYEESYRLGFPNYTFKPFKEKYLKERRENIQRRYKILKRIRTVVKPYGPLRRIFLPGKKRLIIDFHEYERPIFGIISIIEMINWYNEPYEIYQYSGIENTGYRYYSGEKIILYIISPRMKKSSIKKISKAAKMTKVNGYNIEKCYKVIITLKKWKGCKGWNTIKGIDYINYHKRDLREEALLSWKNCQTLNELEEKNQHLKWCKKQGLEPWPFKWKPEVKKYFDTYNNGINNNKPINSTIKNINQIVEEIQKKGENELEKRKNEILLQCINKENSNKDENSNDDSSTITHEDIQSDTLDTNTDTNTISINEN